MTRGVGVSAEEAEKSVREEIRSYIAASMNSAAVQEQLITNLLDVPAFRFFADFKRMQLAEEMA